MNGPVDDIGVEKIKLEAQPWALISRTAADHGHEETLIKSIRDTLDEWSFTGAPTQVGGQVWPAISQLLTWGYMRSRPDLAWRSLNRNTFAAHASVFPPSWFNIWTGPDATNCHGSPNPGGAWVSPLTPMTDFPAMNANPDAMALLRDEPDVFPFVNHEFHLQCIARTVTSCLTPSDFDRILTRV